MWLDNLLRIPFEEYSGIDIDKGFLPRMKKELDKKLCFLENPKD